MQIISRWPGAALAALLALGAAAAPAAAQDRSGEVTGRVLGPDGAPARHVEVRAVGANRTVDADEEGRFRLRMPAGSHVIEAEGGLQGRAVRRVQVEAGGVVEIELALEPAFHVEPIIASVGPEARTRSELFQATDVLSGRELREKARNTLGETLAEQPGVNSTFYGQGASRPVIRGLQSDRVRILTGGVGSGDVSSSGPDHAVAIEPLSAERIEVLRGPSTLLYGSSAIGGVVNVIDGRIPRDLPAHPLEGTLQLQGATVNEEANGAAALKGRAGSVAWAANGLLRDADDYDIPGFAAANPDPADPGPRGTLPNSAVETQSGSLGASWIGGAGYVGAAFTAYASEYGVPGFAEEEEGGTDGEPGAEPEAGVSLDVDQWRLDFEGSWNFAGAAIRTLKARAGYSDYKHIELEGDEIGTRFDNEELDTRLEATHEPLFGSLSGTVGLQFGDRDLAAVGEEAFLPPVSSTSWAVFLLEELPLGSASLGLGARWERAEHDTGTGLSRDSDGFSASLGVNVPLTGGVTLALSGARSTKLPSVEERFSLGPHAATRLVELGDPDLENEIGYSGDLSLLVTEGPVTGEVSFFVSRFDDFIFLRPTGEFEEGFRVALYEQADALFTGFEARLAVSLLHEPGNHLALTAFSDYVRAEETESDEPLPYIPPLRFGGGARWEVGPWRVVAEARRTTEQDRISEFETETEGFTMLNASIGYVLISGPVSHEITLRGTNLGDETARNHVSFLKDTVPLPGRDIRLTYRLRF